jgi:NAD(P)-dependent dehydrogenase (short-subunit alcohol dehydrogenase family)
MPTNLETTMIEMKMDGRCALVTGGSKGIGYAAAMMGRVGTAEEFANMILFLASDAGGDVTGTAINVDGGFCPVV